jgi:hypothetical protein
MRAVPDTKDTDTARNSQGYGHCRNQGCGHSGNTNVVTIPCEHLPKDAKEMRLATKMQKQPNFKRRRTQVTVQLAKRSRNPNPNDACTFWNAPITE